MRQAKIITILAIVASVAFMFIGCGDSGSGGAGGETGRISLSVTDAPVDFANSVVVTFSGVEIKPAAGNSISFNFSTDKTIDLLALGSSESASILNGETLSAGKYNWIRLAVKADKATMDSYIKFDDGTMESLYVPSGATSGLKLNRRFNVPENGIADFTIDFDLRKSVHAPSGPDSYTLRPTLRIIDNASRGAIEGTVSATLINSTSSNAVYIFNGTGAITDDVGSANEPLTSVAVIANTGYYKAGFLDAGPYTLAFTNSADLDDPAIDDDLIFNAIANVTVVSGQTAVQDFP